TATLDVTSLGSVTDNSGTTPAITYAISGTPLSGAYAFPLGVTTVTMDASDGAGNAAVQQSFTVTVTDGEVPVITA
ncbi:HYR domain-containing protein, partial [Tritonibacter mobilis]